jgi:hypothetical protein
LKTGYFDKNCQNKVTILGSGGVKENAAPIDLPLTIAAQRRLRVIQIALTNDMAEQPAESWLPASMTGCLPAVSRAAQENRTSTDFAQFVDLFAQVYKS